jgi:hypothetical protein
MLAECVVPREVFEQFVRVACSIAAQDAGRPHRLLEQCRNSRATFHETAVGELAAELVRALNDVAAINTPAWAVRGTATRTHLVLHPAGIVIASGAGWLIRLTPDGLVIDASSEWQLDSVVDGVARCRDGTLLTLGPGADGLCVDAARVAPETPFVGLVESCLQVLRFAAARRATVRFAPTATTTAG